MGNKASRRSFTFGSPSSAVEGGEERSHSASVPSTSLSSLANDAIAALNEVGATPLHYACYEGRLEAVKQLLNFGADVTARTHYGRTPLHFAVSGGQVEVAAHLLRHTSSDLQDTDWFGDSSLHRACSAGHLHMIERLIQWGANINAVNHDGVCASDLVLDEAKRNKAASVLQESSSAPESVVKYAGEDQLVEKFEPPSLQIDTSPAPEPPSSPRYPEMLISLADSAGVPPPLFSQFTVSRLLVLEVELLVARTKMDHDIIRTLIQTKKQLRQECQNIGISLPSHMMEVRSPSSSNTIDTARVSAISALQTLITDLRCHMDLLYDIEDITEADKCKMTLDAAEELLHRPCLLYSDMLDQYNQTISVAPTASISSSTSVELGRSTRLPSQDSESMTLHRELVISGGVYRDSTVSSGLTMICDAVLIYSNRLGKNRSIEVKVKLAPNTDVATSTALRREFGYLQHLHEECPGTFIKPIEFIDSNSALVVSSELGEDCSCLVGFAMQRGKANLQQLVSSNKLPEFVDKLRAARDLVKMVAAAHKAQLVLCDLKLANVVFLPDEEGVGHFVGVDLDSAYPLHTDVVVGDIVATLQCMCPMLEKCRRENSGAAIRITHAIDVWSLGMCLLQLFLGEDFYASQGIIGEVAIRDKLFTLTQEDITTYLRTYLNSSQLRPLREFLCDALQVQADRCISLESLCRKHQFLSGGGAGWTPSALLGAVKNISDRNTSDLKELIVAKHDETTADLHHISNKLDTLVSEMRYMGRHAAMALQDVLMHRALCGDDGDVSEMLQLTLHETSDALVSISESKTATDVRTIAATMQASLHNMLTAQKDMMSEAAAKQEAEMQRQFATIISLLSSHMDVTTSQLSIVKSELASQLEEVKHEISAVAVSVERIAHNIRHMQDCLSDFRSEILLHQNEASENLQALQSALSDHMASVSSALGAATSSSATIDQYRDLHDAICLAVQNAQIAFKFSALTSRGSFAADDDNRMSLTLRVAVDQSLAACLPSMEIAQNKETLEQLRAMATALTSMHQDLTSIRNEVGDLGADMKRLISATASLNTMMGSMLRADTRVPLLMVLTPIKQGDVRNKVRSVFSSSMALFFVCPITKRIAASGKDGKGYRMDVPKGWIARVAPILQFAAVALRISLVAMGVPSPFLALPGLGFNIDLPLVEDLINDLKEQESVDRDVIRDCSELLENTLDRVENGEEALALAGQRLANMAAMKHACESVYTLLKDKLEKPRNPPADWRPKHTGLVFIDGSMTPDGSSAWVSPEAAKTYMRLGQQAFTLKQHTVHDNEKHKQHI